LSSIAGFNFYNATMSAGIKIDDVYVSDNTTPAPTGYLGVNAKVYSPDFSGGATYGPEWQEVYYGTIYAPGSFDGSTLLGGADGDQTSVRAAQFNKISAWNLVDISPPSGSSAAIGAVRLNAVARKASLDAAYKYVFTTQGGVKNEIGAKIAVTNDNYTSDKNQIITTNPATGTNWTVDQFNAGYFGLKLVDPAS
jgi:hypothetical protein